MTTDTVNRTELHRVPTDQLHLGDIVLNEGMRVLLDRDPIVTEKPDGADGSIAAQEGRTVKVYAWVGLVLNVEEAMREYRIPRSFMEDDRYNIQGNHRATWTVLRPWLEVTVLHNETLGHFDSGYEPGDELFNVFGFSFPADTDLLALCERVYAITNSYPEELFGAAVDHVDLVAAYRAAKLRSLSVGDVLVVDGKAFAAAPMGFTELAEVPNWQTQAEARNDIKVALARWDAKAIGKFDFYGVVEAHLTAGLVSVRTVADITGIETAVIEDRVQYLRHLGGGR